ncbi:MAG: DUF916 domain-containing protein [Candidatus Saccharibacteria bacterium]
MKNFKINRRQIMLPVATVWTAVVLLLAIAPGLASAAGANGLRVSPVRTDITVAPGQTKIVTITVTNITSTAASLQAVINDFAASSDESGQPAIILNSNQFAKSHSLKRFTKALPNFTLQPGEQKNVSLPITVPADAAGGGYYGAIRFAPATPGGPNQTVSLAGSVGSLIIATVPGDIKDQLNISSFDVRSGVHPRSLFTSSKAITGVVRFQNSGNIQEQPFGKILLKDRSGKILGQYEINSADPRSNVLPDSIRKFSVPLDKVGTWGVFKLEGNFGYGSNGQLLSASTTFYVIPLIVILLFIAAVIVLAFLIFGLPRLVRAYNRRIIQKSNRR